MNKRLERGLRLAGAPIEVRIGDEIRRGYGIIYPVRDYQKPGDGINHDPEGRTDSVRYALFCDSALLGGAEYGTEVRCAENRYLLIRSDDYCARSCGYVKALMRKCTVREEEL